jgi:hypothetical protein
MSKKDLSDLSDLLTKYEAMFPVSRTIRLNQLGSSVGSVTEGMQKRLRGYLEFIIPNFDFNRWLKIDVGDNIWYLAICASILPFTGDNYQENAAKILGFLAKYLERLDNIKPLKSIQKYSDLSTYMDWTTFTKVWETDSVPHVIREMRFEMWMLNRNTEFPSTGPKASSEEGVTKKPETSLGQLYCGLLSIPIGPLGVMETLSVFSESMGDMIDAYPGEKEKVPISADEAVVISNPVGWKCVRIDVLQGLMSPMTDMEDMCPGVHLVEHGYVIMNRDAEYPAAEFTGYDKIQPFSSFRYYLRRDAKWPLPGEFIGLLAKPWPTHVWWFQETSPFLYAGNWFETNYYTSGIISEILAPLEGKVGLVYKCVVRGVEVCIAASDFYGYVVGDRVAILRIGDLDRFLDKTRGNFKWKEMVDLIASEKAAKELPSNEAYIVNSNMMILPMSFYKAKEALP